MRVRLSLLFVLGVTAMIVFTGCFAASPVPPPNVPLSSDATLSDLYVTATTGSVDPIFPDFDPATLEYWVIGVGRFSITPTATDPNAVIRVEGEVVVSGETSLYDFQCGPNPGESTPYTVEVTAQDGTTVLEYIVYGMAPPT